MQNETLASSGSSRARALSIFLMVLAAGAGFVIGRQSGTTKVETAAPGVAPIAGVRDARRGELIEALRIRDPFERAAWLGSQLPSLGAGSIDEVRYALQSNVVEPGPVEYELLARHWARIDPELAFSWAYTQSPVAYRDGLVRAVALEWALRDPRAALREISTRPGGKTNESATMALIAGWFESGEPGLESFIYDMGYSFERQLAVSVWLRAVGLRDGPQAIADLAESVSPEDDRYKRTVMRKAAGEMTTLDPAYGVAWEEKHGQGPYGDTILRPIVARWAVQDGAAAMEWLSQVEPGKRRDTALRDAFRLWRQRDRAAMFKWVDEMGIDGVEPWFEPAIGLYVMAVSAVDPPKAMAWADLMTDEVKQRSARITVARRWQRSDPEAAEAWILASDLTEKERAVAREPLPIKKSTRPYFERLPPRPEDSDDEFEGGDPELVEEASAGP